MVIPSEVRLVKEKFTHTHNPNNSRKNTAKGFLTLIIVQFNRVDQFSALIKLSICIILCVYVDQINLTPLLFS
jgi:hypothetical protein